MTDNMLTFFFSRTYEPEMGCHAISQGNNGIHHVEGEVGYQEPL